MSVFARPAVRWAIPAVALVAVIGAAGAGKMLVANASSGLPERSPQQLLMDVAQARVDSLSGTIVQKSDLCLPKLPELDGTDLNAMVTGSHTAKVWYDGPQRVRLSVQGTGVDEKDAIRNGKNVWLYDSATKSATHRTLSTDAAKRPSAAPSVLPSTGPSSLPGGVTQLLTRLAPSTNIGTDGTAKVAGRKAYELVITPKQHDSRVEQIRIAIDGDKHIPLRVQIFARGSADPAFEAGFTSVSFAKPDAAEFRFDPPAGTTVTEAKPGSSDHSKVAPKDRDHQRGEKGDQPQIIGTGWTSVMVAKGVDTTVPAGKTAEQKKASEAATKFLDSLPKVHGSWGSGRLVETKLFSVLITDDGRVLAGAVAPAQLYQAAAQTK
jgi:outer membrane lipoprotein-sorting protein